MTKVLVDEEHGGCHSKPSLMFKTLYCTGEVFGKVIATSSPIGVYFAV